MCICMSFTLFARQMPEEESIQVLLFSATMPSWVRNMASQYQTDPYSLDVVGDQETRLATTVTHYVRPTPAGKEDKLDALVDVLAYHSKGGMVIAFVNTKMEAHWMSEQRRLQMFSPCFLHGDMSQSLRDQTMAGLRAGKFRVLVATDVASRGIDLEGIEVVVQWSPPRDVDTYVHRSGRTGRAGRSGTAITFFSPKEARFVEKIGRDLKTTWKVTWGFSTAQKRELKVKEVINAVRTVDSAVLSKVQPQLLAALPNMTDNADGAALLKGPGLDLLSRFFALMMDTGHQASMQRSMLSGASHTTTYHLVHTGERSNPAMVLDMMHFAILDANPDEDISLGTVVPLKQRGEFLVDIKEAPEGWEAVLQSFLPPGCTLKPALTLPDSFTLADLNRGIDIRNRRAQHDRERRASRRGGGRFGSDRDRGGRDRGRPGDWECPQCGINNFASRYECFRCRTERPMGSRSGRGGGGGRGGRFGDSGGRGGRFGDGGGRGGRFGGGGGRGGGYAGGAFGRGGRGGGGRRERDGALRA